MCFFSLQHHEFISQISQIRLFCQFSSNKTFAVADREKKGQKWKNSELFSFLQLHRTFFFKIFDVHEIRHLSHNSSSLIIIIMALFAFQHFTCKQFYARILGILGMGRGVFLQQELSDLKGGRYFTYYSRMQCKKIELCSFKPEFSPSQFDAPLRVHLSSFLAFVCLALCATFYFLLPKYVSYETQKVWKKFFKNVI